MTGTKIPGLGNYGNYIDNINFNHVFNKQWLELGKNFKLPNYKLP